MKFWKLSSRNSNARIVEVGVTNKLAKIKEIINMLFEVMLFNRAGEVSNSPELISLKSHSRCVEKEMCDDFQGGKPLLLEFF